MWHNWSECVFGKGRTGLVLVVVLVLVIEKPRKAEDEHENEHKQEGFTWFSKQALTESAGWSGGTLPAGEPASRAAVPGSGTPATQRGRQRHRDPPDAVP